MCIWTVLTFLRFRVCLCFPLFEWDWDTWYLYTYFRFRYVYTYVRTFVYISEPITVIPSPKIKRLFWRDFLTNSRLGPEEFRTKFWECSSDHQDDHISKNHHFPLLVKQVNLTNDVTKKAVRDSLKPLRKTEGQDSNVKGAAKKLLKTGSPTRHFGQTKFLVKKSLPKLIRKKMWSEITSWIGWKSHTPTPLNHQVLPETLVSHYAIRRCPGKRPHERRQEAPS